MLLGRAQAGGHARSLLDLDQGYDPKVISEIRMRVITATLIRCYAGPAPDAASSASPEVDARF
jgi:hypothetical protein